MCSRIILFGVLGISTLLQSIVTDRMFVVKRLHVVLILQVVELNVLKFIHDILVLQVFTLWVLIQSHLRDDLLP